MNTTDTIAAPASAISGAVAVIRISGERALPVAEAVWQGKAKLDAPENLRKMLLGKVGNAPTLAVYMKAPRSYTGEDVVELQCHGGAAAAHAVMTAVLDAGCRLAEPGEFTFRAFVNGKMDLVQAEAVADLVRSGSDAARKVAENQLAGSLSEKLTSLYEAINDFRSECEARLDFPDEELEFTSGIPDSIIRARKLLESLLQTYPAGAALREGVTIVLAGKPNSGKSSLLNLLAGRDRAIVSDIPGTTRDTIECDTQIRGIPVHLVDTAGMRESADKVEKLGIERSHRSIAAAQLVLWLLDMTAQDIDGEIAEMRRSAPADTTIAVWNKLDLAEDKKLPGLPTDLPCATISAKNGKNLEALFDAIMTKLFSCKTPNIPETAINARAAGELGLAEKSLMEANRHFDTGGFELAAAESAQAAHAVGRIIGKYADPDLLDSVFRNFCIGK